ncbi:MAG: hypothetical protein JWR70_2045 [Modestobacter sp.]|jgi:hypothetical protein|nr:hypothetical protein [Modestobacter sp.]
MPATSRSGSWSEDLEEYVGDVAGRLIEELTGGPGRRALSMRRPTSTATQCLSRAEARPLGKPGRHTWAPWPVRDG